MKKVKIFSVLLAIVMLITTFSACGGNKVKKNDIVGQWYASDGEMEIDVRKDGTYDDGGYGTGTWKYLDDGVTIEFKDFYGSTKKTTVVNDEYGYSIYNGRYYRDEYPEEKLTNNNNSNSGFVNGNDNLKNEAPTDTQKITIDAFAGISYEITGISPNCKISINNSGCSADAQQRVTYKLDKEYYANGETAVITATIPVNKIKEGKTEYALVSNQSTHDVSNQPEYVTSVDEKIISAVKRELNDFVTAQKSEAIGNWGLFGIHAKGNSYSKYKSVDTGKLEETYFTSIKQNKINKDVAIYNSLNFIYSFSATMHDGSINGTESCKVYVNIIANNIVKYPDGTVKWGEKDPDAFDFSYKGSLDGVSNLVTTTVTIKSSDYNISKVAL